MLVIFWLLAIMSYRVDRYLYNCITENYKVEFQFWAMSSEKFHCQVRSIAVLQSLATIHSSFFCVQYN